MELAPLAPGISETSVGPALGAPGEPTGSAGAPPGAWQARTPPRTATLHAPRPFPLALLAGLALLCDTAALSSALLLVHAVAAVLDEAAAAVPGPLTWAAGLTALVLGARHGAYGSCVLLDTRARQMSVLLPAAAVGWALAIVLAVATGGLQPSPAWTATSALVGLGLLAAGRAAFAGVLQGSAGNRFAPRAMVIGGDGAGLRAVVDHLRGGTEGRLRLLGAASDNDNAAEFLRAAGSPYMGGIDAAFARLRCGDVEHVVLPADWAVGRGATEVLPRLADALVEVHLAVECAGNSGDAPRRMRLLRLQEHPIAGLRAAVKSTVDVAGASAALVLAAVPMLIIALAIRMESPGPVLFPQRRTGFKGREFRILKFRTMHHHTADVEGRRQVVAGDDRVTKVGAVLRRTSLDELPQLFNILAGEMSFVGPRPHAPETLAGGRRFDEVAARYAARHRVKPGLTGLAQVRGWRGPTDTEEKLLRRLECDLEYIERWSLSLDLAIVAHTLIAVASMKNAH